MQTAWQAISSKGIELKRSALSVLFVFAIPRAFACADSASGQGQTGDINFDFDSSSIRNAEILSLANWIVDTRTRNRVLEGVSIVGLADKREHDPQRLAEGRANEARQTLEAFGVRAATTGVTAHVYKPTMPEDKYEPTGTRAEVTLIPACTDQ